MTPKVGEYVYRPFRPKMPGRIIAVFSPLPPRKYFHFVTVKWLNGVVEDTDTLDLNDFQALIEDHRKKLKTHLATLKKLEAME